MHANLEVILFWAVAIISGASAVAVVVTQNIVRAATFLLFALAGVSGVFFLLGADFVGATQILVYVGGTLVLVVFGVMLTAQGPFITMKTSAAEWAIAAVVGLLFFAVLAGSLLSGGGTDPAEVRDLVRKLDNDSSADTRAEAALRLWSFGAGAVAAMPNAIEQAGLSDDGKKHANELLRRLRERMNDPSTSMSSALLGEALLGINNATMEGPVTGAKFQARGELEARAAPGGRQAVAGQRRRQRVNYLFPFEIVSVHLLVVLIGAAYLARAKRRRGATA